VPLWDTSARWRNADCADQGLEELERLPDLRTKSPQQRNVVLHPEFVDGKYALYTRPRMNSFKRGRAEASAGTV